MRRVSGRYAKPGMVLGRPIYDSRGLILFERKTKLSEDDVQKLVLYGVSEVIVDDPRVEDVPVQPLLPPELEAEASLALRQLLTEAAGESEIHPALLAELERPVFNMVRELFPDCMGEPSATGGTTEDDYRYVRPVKAAGLSMLIGRKAGMGAPALGVVGLASMLMDVGTIGLPVGALEQSDWVLGSESEEFRRHPELGAAVLERSSRAEPLVQAVAQPTSAGMAAASRGD